MRRGAWIGLVLLVLALAAGGYAVFGGGFEKPSIVVGILHSQTGPLAGTEKPIIDAEVLALEEINAEGGLLGRRLTWVIADGRSRPADFAQQAQRLITIDKVSVIFGVSSSACRKRVKPVIEENQHMLFYPTSYEGMEESSRIVYTGGPANQQVGPAVSWCFEKFKARKYFLVGSDSLWGRAVSALASDYIKARGAEVVDEHYILPDSTDVSAVVEKIKQAPPDLVFSAIEGETNAAFYARLRQAGITSERTPVVSMSVNEEDLRALPIKDMIGHFSAWNYVQSSEQPANERFVKRYKARYGQDRVTSDSVASAYNAVRLWAQAVTESETDEIEHVLKSVRRQSLDAPEGLVSVDHSNLNNWRPFFLGKVRGDGQFEIVFQMPKAIQPVLYPRTRSKSEWNTLLGDLSASWGGEWANPSRSK
jgi:urea transport system substrate-binding protein